MQEIQLWIPVQGVSTEVLCTSDAKEEQSGHVEAVELPLSPRTTNK